GRPERDPRDDLPKPIFKKGVLKLEDLIAGMELKGTVLNVVDFGAFVDIGLKDSGLVHISQLANRYIKTPHDVVSVGDVVTVWVMSVDQERKRVSLTMVKPGTERQRGAAQGGQRRGQGGGEQREGQAGQGQGRRDRARPPRPSGSALTSPPVGAAPIAALAEPPARRPDRDRGGAPGSQGHAGPPEGGAGQGPGPGPVSGQAFPGNRPGPGFPGPAGSGRGGPRGDRSCLARGVPDLDQGGRNGLRASAAPRGLRALALRLRHFRRKHSPAVCPCAPSGSSSSYGKRGSMRLRKSWPRQRRQQRQPKLELASRRASRPRLQFRPEILPIRNRPTRNPRRPRNPIRGRTRHSKLRDRKNVRHEGKVRRATTARDLAFHR